MLIDELTYLSGSLVDDQINCAASLSTEPSPDFILHCHPFYEIYYYEEGDVTYRVEGQEFRFDSPCVLLIAPNTFHGVLVNNQSPYRRASVHFMSSLLEPDSRRLLTGAFRGANICYSLPPEHQLKHFIQDLLAVSKLPAEIRSIAIRSRLTALLCEIYALHSGASVPQTAQSPQISRILDYLNHHLADTLTLDQLSQRFYVSKNHLNVLFREATGTTVMQYLRLKRLAVAQKAIYSGQALNEAAQNAGFGSYSNFFRAYKQSYGCSPSLSLNDLSRPVSVVKARRTDMPLPSAEQRQEQERTLGLSLSPRSEADR
ncbi:AraC family transcriptional regulator [Oscillospiraceae bacterium HV4-5-C5C]|nr:AraC family transcriptional regulator [Oscillospiraceae bacterium HV4-5-C5C]